MPAAVVTPRTRDRAPPAKKARLAQSPATARHQHGLKAMLNPGSAKPVANTNGLKRARAEQVDDATAVVAGPGHVDVIEISSAEEESEYGSEEEDDDHDDPTQPGAEQHAPVAAGAADDYHDHDHDNNAAEPEDMTFGDRLRAEGPEPVHESRIISVEDAFDPNPERTVAAQKSRPLAPPNANSLGTVLTQALRTNDKELLDSCLQVVDVESVYATVERLPSPLVGTLLQRLAERLHRSPGRAGMLMAWVQWSL